MQKTVKNISNLVLKMEGLLAQIKLELEKLNNAAESTSTTKVKRPKEPPPSSEESITEYEILYQKFTSSNASAITEFINSKSKNYLKAFCQFNNIPIDTKISKERIATEIMQWMAQRKVITQKVT